MVGTNPYGNLSNDHSAWPILLVMYNLSPWLCMKRKHDVLDIYCNKSFKIYAMIFCTINEFLKYGNLCG
ncbi:hypothetical protein L6164_026320 [Bauhinia variegata]|uniref:Uncharacterized protein n=1 Tax=Bauhinia variegata TaxID=167791 RepID=A0ACB9LQ68_BAUVA|nr:hypothetical protein L6164_026320 [Bauhinia variegata]